MPRLKKRKGITPKKDHLGPYYQVRVSRKHPATGRKHERRRKVRGPYADAVDAKIDLARELEAEIGGRLSRAATLTDYAQQWIELRVERLAPSTLRKYLNDLENHILPVLGHIRLTELTPSHVKAMFARDPGAPHTKSNRLRLLRAIAKDAVADRIITWDFTARVSVKIDDVYSDDEPNLLTPGQLDRLLDEFRGEWLDALFLFAFTGMRWCEVAGLQWRDIDLACGELKIRRANVKGIIGPPKTRKSRRDVGLVPEVCDRLRARRQRMLASQHPGLANGWVFPRQDGRHYAGNPFAKELKRACKAIGITFRFTTHGLRRTYNNIARRLADPLVLRATMGHNSEQMTEHYSHIDISEKRSLSLRVVDVVRNRRHGPDA